MNPILAQTYVTPSNDVSLSEINISMEEQVTDRSYADYGLMWQKLTHATLLIGWGYDETKDMKYWLVRNSYGSSWGEHGNFKVRRGQNDYGGEGESMAATPVLL